MRKLRIRLASLRQPIGELSGGNQQKAILARWLLTDPRILILDEPTRGIDIGVKAEFYDMIGELAAAGRAILLISSELPELLALCDRVLVMSEGRLTADIPRAEATQESDHARRRAAHRPGGRGVNALGSILRRREAGIFVDDRRSSASSSALIKPRFLTLDKLRIMLLLVPADHDRARWGRCWCSSPATSTLDRLDPGLLGDGRGMMFKFHPAIPWWLGFPVAIGTGVVLGLVNGAAGDALPAARRSSSRSARSISIAASPSSSPMPSQIDRQFIPGPLKAMSQNSPTYARAVDHHHRASAVILLTYWFANHTRAGRQVYALGSNPVAAPLRGIPVTRVTLMVFAISGALRRARRHHVREPLGLR